MDKCYCIDMDVTFSARMYIVADNEESAREMALDEEQMSILKEVENALAKAKNAGIRFVCDIDDDSIYAYSNKQIKGIEYDCCSDRHISSYGYGINDLMTEVSDGGNCTAIARSDCKVFVKFNEEE